MNRRHHELQSWIRNMNSDHVSETSWILVMNQKCHEFWSWIRNMNFWSWIRNMNVSHESEMLLNSMYMYITNEKHYMYMYIYILNELNQERDMFIIKYLWVACHLYVIIYTNLLPNSFIIPNLTKQTVVMNYRFTVYHHWIPGCKIFYNVWHCLLIFLYLLVKHLSMNKQHFIKKGQNNE